MTPEEIKQIQLDKLYKRIDVEPSDEVLADCFDDAIQLCLDYTGRDRLTMPVAISAKRLAIVMYNQLDDEGETKRVEGGVERDFETGIPANIRASLNPYRVVRTRRL